jgi:twinkle protein
VSECAELLTPGKAKVASLPLKDPNDCLMQGKGEEVIRAIWNAKTFRPDGIVSGQDLLEEVLREDTRASIPYPWPDLNKLTRGLRQAELVTVTAGSGIGKSAIVREIAHHLLMQGETVGMLMLEEDVKRTALGLMGITLNKPVHIDRTGVSEDDMRTAFEATLGTGRLFLYDHFGSTDIENLLNRVRYMARSLDCRWVVLDHLSIVVSGLGDGDERRLIDNAMTMLRTLVQETGIGLILVSHLKRPSDKGHEEGAKTSLSQLRGSHSIAQLSDIVIGAERNQQGENPNTTLIRVLKNRFTGQTGEACHLLYDPETGRLHETSPEFGEEPEDKDF